MRLVAPLIVEYSTSCRLVVDYFASAACPGASARRAARHAAHRAARRRLLRLAQAHRRLLCLAQARRGQLCPGSSSTTSPPPRVRVPWHVARLVMRLVAPLVVDYSASCRLVVDYFAYATRLGASARPRLIAWRRLLRLRRATGCLGTSRGSSRGSLCCSSSTTLPRAGSSSITSPPPRVWVPRHVARLVSRIVARLVVDYFSYAAWSGASARSAARRVARCAARRRLLRLRRASRCLGMSRGPSHSSSSTTPCAVTSSCGHAGSTSATSCVVTTCLAATLALLRVHRAPPRRRSPASLRRPFISTSFPN
jgi:hypothetical protein